MKIERKYRSRAMKHEKSTFGQKWGRSKYNLPEKFQFVFIYFSHYIFIWKIFERLTYKNRAEKRAVVLLTRFSIK